MKISERERYNYNKHKEGTNRGGYVKIAPAKFNIDGPELLEWMRTISKIKGFGIKELPVCIKLESSTAIGRFMDMDTLKVGRKVCIYVVREWGLYRQWINVDSKMFTNDGSATQLTAVSLDKLMASIMKYKDGKRIDQVEGVTAIEDFFNRYVKAAEKGTTGTNDALAGYMYNEFGIELPEDYTLAQLKEEFNKKAAATALDLIFYKNDGDDYARHESEADYKIK